MKNLPLLVLLTCTAIAQTPAPATVVPAPAASTPATSPAQAPVQAKDNGRQRFEAATVWVQTSGEWRALSYQGWQLARLRLDALLPAARTKPPAVVVDIDEFNGKTAADRNSMVDSLRSEFGTHFIVFPNPINGDWESALYVSQRPANEADRERIRHEQLRPYK